MLDALRRGSKSWLAKSLLGLLVLSFGVWGVADYMVRGGGPKPAITVGGQSFGAGYVRNQFSEDLGRLRRQGIELDAEQAIAMGLLGQTVQTIVQGAVLDESGRRLGLVASDDALRSAIQNDPLFKGADGRFDRDRLSRILAANNLTEAGYIDLRRRDMIREALVEPVVSAVGVPGPIVDVLAAHASERRVAQVLTVAKAALPAPTTKPTEEALEKVRQENLDRFTAPEYRTAKALLLTRDAVAGSITVADEAIAQYYEAHGDEFVQPASRRVTQALFSSREQADSALVLIRSSSASLDEASRKITGSGAIDMGNVTDSSLPAPLPATIAAQDVGVVGEPAQSPLGWHLFLVTAATPETTKPLAEVAPQIRKTLASDQAVDSLYALSTQVEDLLAGGAGIDEVATQVGLPLLAFSVDSQGNSQDGTPAKGLPSDGAFLKTLFGLGEGEVSPMIDYEGGFFIQRLETITPRAPRPLDAVRAEVVALWQDQEQTATAGRLAEGLLSRAKAGASFEDLAAAEPASRLSTTPPVTRDGRSDGAAEADPLPGALVQAMFAARQGDVVRADGSDGVSLLRVLEIRQPSAEIAARERASVEQSLRQAYSADVANGYSAALGDTVGVTVDQGVVLDAVKTN
ncbi:hypothetical protein F11_09715 [Rhodospirillum rubrum F11]|uniref:Parvulin-like PPIase n=5 Tax=Rhodospirillum rubrum TaxID=1085 RepID=Q2RT55_RHORT|nr:peptidyl-prolyl cis-trans isomerase [Rhodospirillum rubrum]ABC22690.1 hypothetical protein Rru_A1890 [Rhodospirillum rubrum ATCC 11170]AEO48409.1 hypothetical protein F11_09715 [Rhodospirillum rubrum F11]QXG78684.1 SurA N-terminal domain-containing protein [Rhodospirillum rubrum]